MRRWTLAVLLVSALGRAEEPSASDINAARELGKEGIKLADAGKCSDAVVRFARAEKLYHAPTILARLGECQVKLGKLVEGTENLQRVVHEALPDKPPPAFVKARERAQKILKEVEGKIGRLKIVVKAPPKAEIAVKIDGDPINSAFLGAERPTDPGEHFVEVVAPGYLKSSETIVIKEGKSETITLTLAIDPEAPPPPPEEKPVVKVTPPPPPSSSGVKTAGLVLLGVGGVGIVVGSIFGFVTVAQRSDLDARCPMRICPPGDQGAIDSANAMGWISTVGFVVGGAGLAIGLGMVLAGGSGSPPKHTSLVVGPDSIVLGGAF